MINKPWVLIPQNPPTEEALIFGELLRHKGESKFKEICQDYPGGLHATAVNYGINII